MRIEITGGSGLLHPYLRIAMLAHDFELHVARLFGEDEDYDGFREASEVEEAVLRRPSPGDEPKQ